MVMVAETLLQLLMERTEVGGRGMVMVVGCRGNRGGQENGEIEENGVGGPEGKEESRKSRVEKKSEERKRVRRENGRII